VPASCQNGDVMLVQMRLQIATSLFLPVKGIANLSVSKCHER